MPKWTQRLRRRLQLRQALQLPGVTVTPPPAPTAEEQQVAQRTVTPAKQAFAWTTPIERHNRILNARYGQKILDAYAQMPWPHRLPLHFQALVDLERSRYTQEELATAVMTPPEQAVCWDLAEALVSRQSRNMDVKDLAPLQGLLTPEERADAAEAARLATAVQIGQREGLTAEETQRLLGTPSPLSREVFDRAVLAAAGGDTARAAQLQAKLDELFGVGVE